MYMIVKLHINYRVFYFYFDIKLLDGSTINNLSQNMSWETYMPDILYHDVSIYDTTNEPLLFETPCIVHVVEHPHII